MGEMLKNQEKKTKNTDVVAPEKNKGSLSVQSAQTRQLIGNAPASTILFRNHH
jgi:hypothetical protein